MPNENNTTCKTCGKTLLPKQKAFCSHECLLKSKPRLGTGFSIEEKFWRRVDRNGTIPSHCPALGCCWLWTGKPGNNGYGKLEHEGKTISAHVAGYHIQIGQQPEGYKILHHCDVKMCVRGSHLFTGTTADNHHDAMRKDRNSRGEIHGMAKLTELKVKNIWNLHRSGVSIVSIARKFGVSDGAIHRILHGSAWKHVQH